MNTSAHYGVQAPHEKSEEQQAEDLFCIAAWNMRKRQTFGFLEDHHIQDYEQTRHVLQEMGWSEDGIDALESQYVGLQSSKWKVVVA